MVPSIFVSFNPRNKSLMTPSHLNWVESVRIYTPRIGAQAQEPIDLIVNALSLQSFESTMKPSANNHERQGGVNLVQFDIGTPKLPTHFQTLLSSDSPECKSAKIKEKKIIITNGAEKKFVFLRALFPITCNIYL